jgi:hypothetical protein
MHRHLVRKFPCTYFEDKLLIYNKKIVSDQPYNDMLVDICEKYYYDILMDGTDVSETTDANLRNIDIFIYNYQYIASTTLLKMYPINNQLPKRVIGETLSCGCITNPYDVHTEPCNVIGNKVTKDYFVIGHWKEDIDETLDWYQGQEYANLPIENSATNDQTEEIRALNRLEQKLGQRGVDMIPGDKYKRNGYMGSSECRICGIRNGSHEYVFESWVWPEGYSHYLTEHNVAIHPEFGQFIKSIDYSEFDSILKPWIDLSDEMIQRIKSYQNIQKIKKGMQVLTFA